MTAVQVGLGCVRLGGGDGRTVADDVRLVHAAIDLGVTVFDTADVYGGGASEHVLGRAVRERRDEVRVATKGGFVFRPRTVAEQWARRRAKDVLSRLPERSGGGSSSAGGSSGYAAQDFSPRYVRDAVHASLRRLGTDRIDVYQLHGPEAFVPDLVERLVDLVIAGDIVHLGVGADSVEAADQWVGVPDVTVLQVPFGIIDPDAAASTLPAAAGQSKEIWIRGVLGGGLLGLVQRDPEALDDNPKAIQIRRLAALADEHQLDLHDLALRYAISHASDVSAVIVGSTSIDHLAHNVDVLAGPPLDDELKGAVDRLAEQGGAR